MVVIQSYLLDKYVFISRKLISKIKICLFASPAILTPLILFSLNQIINMILRTIYREIKNK